MPPEKQLLYGRNFSVKCLVVGVRRILPDPLYAPSFTRKASHILLHAGGTGLFHRFGDVPVSIQGKGRCRVAKVPLHGFDIISVLQGQNRIGVPKIMDPCVRRADFDSELLEMIISGLGLQRRTEDCGECQRYVREGFSSDEELSLYDMLFRDDLSKTDIKKIKEVSVSLLARVKEKIALLDHWTDKQETKAVVDTLIRDTLWNELPECYDDLSISRYRQQIYEYVYTRYPDVA